MRDIVSSKYASPVIRRKRAHSCHRLLGSHLDHAVIDRLGSAAPANDHDKLFLLRDVHPERFQSLRSIRMTTCRSARIARIEYAFRLRKVVLGFVEADRHDIRITAQKSVRSPGITFCSCKTSEFQLRRCINDRSTHITSGAKNASGPKILKSRFALRTPLQKPIYCLHIVPRQASLEARDLDRLERDALLA